MKRSLFAGMSLISMSFASAALFAQDADDPLLRPIAPDYAKRWLAPLPPKRIFGNSYLVGFGGLNVGLIDTGAGLILIDGSVPQAVRDVEANIRSLGFDVKDVKYILSTEPHYDHAGGIAALARDSGATVIASEKAAVVLRSGKGDLDKDDPQATILASYAPVTRIRAVRDGEVIRLGKVAITARATPGHTLGSMSWTWQSCEGKLCKQVVFASSLYPGSADGYRFSDPDHAKLVATFRQTYAKVRAMKCDILFSAHPDQSGGDVKYAALMKGETPNPFIDPNSCVAYADKFTGILDARLAKETS